MATATNPSPALHFFVLPLAIIPYLQAISCQSCLCRSIFLSSSPEALSNALLSDLTKESTAELWTFSDDRISTLQNRFSPHCVRLFVHGEFDNDLQESANYTAPMLVFPQELTQVYFVSHEGQISCSRQRVFLQPSATVAMQPGPCSDSPNIKSRLLSPSQCIPQFFKELVGGKTFRISILKLSVFSIVVDGQLIGGSVKELLEQVSKMYNFSTEIDYGGKSLAFGPVNGKWPGILGDLEEGKSDAVFYTAITMNRRKHFDFATPSFTGYFSFYMAHRQAAVDWRALIYPLQPLVWLLVALTCGFCLLLLYIEYRKLYTSSVECLYQAVVTVGSALVQQSFTYRKRGRFVSILLTFFALVILTSYSCNLVSFLTLPEKEGEVRTVGQLASAESAKRFKISMMNLVGGSGVTLITTSPEPNLKRIGERTFLENNFTRCIERSIFTKMNVCIGWDFVMENVVADRFSIKSFHPLKAGEEPFLIIPASVALPKWSRHTSFWNAVIGRAQDSGLLQQWKRRGLRLRRKSPPDDIAKGLEFIASKLIARSTQASSLENFVLCIWSAVGGWTLALCAFCAEVTVKFAAKRKEKKRKQSGESRQSEVEIIE